MAIVVDKKGNVDWKTLASMSAPVAIAHRSIFPMSWMSYPLHHFLQVFLHYIESITLQIDNWYAQIILCTTSYKILLKFLKYSSHSDCCQL